MIEGICFATLSRMLGQQLRNHYTHRRPRPKEPRTKAIRRKKVPS